MRIGPVALSRNPADRGAYPDGTRVLWRCRRGGQRSALDQARRYAAGFDDIFNAYDAIITPAAPGVAPKGLSSTGDAAFCTLWTLTGLPSVTLPLLAGTNGMPIGVQVIGDRGRDARLLRTATALVAMLSETQKGKKKRGSRRAS